MRKQIAVLTLFFLFLSVPMVQAKTNRVGVWENELILFGKPEKSITALCFGLQSAVLHIEVTPQLSVGGNMKVYLNNHKVLDFDYLPLVKTIKEIEVTSRFKSGLDTIMLDIENIGIGLKVTLWIDVVASNFYALVLPSLSLILASICMIGFVIIVGLGVYVWKVKP